MRRRSGVRAFARLAARTAVPAALLIGVGATAAAAQQAVDPSLHPTFPLVDEAGRNVLESRGPVSSARTCGACHDAVYIAAHSTHGEGVGCLQCHLSGAGMGDAVSPVADAPVSAGWTEGAALASAGLVTATGDGWRWNDDAFTADGHAGRGFRVVDPTDAACAACHAADGPRGRRTGARFDPRRISESGLNVRGKDTLSRSFDVHAERLVGCVDCHHSVDNPAHDRGGARPAHLASDPRRLDVADYLRRPSHELARTGGPGSGAASGCVSCHTAAEAHDWLPYTERHMAAVACESCHIPEVYGEALQVEDWTLVTPDGRPRLVFRGADRGAGGVPFLEGYTPVLLPVAQSDGTARLSPHNVTTTLRWVDGDGAVVRIARLMDALAPNAAYRPELVADLDRDGDGRLAGAELELRDDRAVAAVAARLESAGVRDPRIEARVTAAELHHGVATGEWATRECSSCHSRAAAGFAPVALAGALPSGVGPDDVVLEGAAGMGRVVRTADGGVALAAAPDRAELYVLGRSGPRWVTWIGILAVLGVLIGAGTHAALRIRAARHAPPVGHGPRRRVYMYGAYERLWHWLQAFAIIGLTATGVAIHRPDTFAGSAFPVVVRVHNVLGFLLLANAFLALFYHLASGKVRQYLPRPRGFFSEAVAQLAYYVRGIFRHEPHPFEKHPDRRLNPLQKVTYLGILNVLLPVQVASGVLIWGAQELPGGTGAGILAWLAPIHTLTAWLFGAFLIMHIYLTTTGHTPTSNLRAMVVGWEEIETNEPVVTLEGEDGVRRPRPSEVAVGQTEIVVDERVAVATDGGR